MGHGTVAAGPPVTFAGREQRSLRHRPPRSRDARPVVRLRPRAGRRGPAAPGPALRLGRPRVDRPAAGRRRGGRPARLRAAPRRRRGGRQLDRRGAPLGRARERRPRRAARRGRRPVRARGRPPRGPGGGVPVAARGRGRLAPRRGLPGPRAGRGARHAGRPGAARRPRRVPRPQRRCRRGDPGGGGPARRAPRRAAPGEGDDRAVAGRRRRPRPAVARRRAPPVPARRRRVRAARAPHVHRRRAGARQDRPGARRDRGGRRLPGARRLPRVAQADLAAGGRALAAAPDGRRRPRRRGAEPDPAADIVILNYDVVDAHVERARGARPARGRVRRVALLQGPARAADEGVPGAGSRPAGGRAAPGADRDADREPAEGDRRRSSG